MITITVADAVAAHLRSHGYDATSRHYDAVEYRNAACDLVMIRAVTVIGWRYPDGTWIWDDREAVLYDKGADPAARWDQPPYFDSEHRWEWLPGRHSPEEHPPDNADAAQLTKWLLARLPKPTQPMCLMYHHPDDVDYNPDLGAEMSRGPDEGPGPSSTTWSWPPDWIGAWNDAEDTDGCPSAPKACVCRAPSPWTPHATQPEDSAAALRFKRAWDRITGRRRSCS